VKAIKHEKWSLDILKLELNVKKHEKRSFMPVTFS